MTAPSTANLDHTASRPALVTPSRAAWLVAVLGIAAILCVYYFQYVLKYQPCPLCLEQRTPYYVVIPLAVLLGLAAPRLPRSMMMVGLVLAGLVMLVGAGLGVYHAGVEWQFWPGPTDCSGSFSAGSAADLLREAATTPVVRCDQAAIRILGLSLAGWNVVAALVMAAIAFVGARSACRRV